MKKIIFVEKQQTNYDPVAAFFNKKAPSVPKSLNSTAKPTSAKGTIDKKNVTDFEKIEKPSAIKKNDEITPNIGKKVDPQTPNIPKPYPLKQQALKSRDLSRTNVKKQSKANIIKDQIPKISTQKSIEEKSIEQRNEKANALERDDSIQKMKLEEPVRPIRKEKVEGSKADNLAFKIKGLQQRQEQYIRKIEELQAKQQKYVKNEQKLLKVQKDLKAAVLKSKEGEAALEKLKQKEAQIKQMLEGTTIPFNRRRQVILNNKIRQLKRINRELTLRIKNYKGSDLVQLSTQQNREQITKELYTVDVDNELKAEMNTEMESLVVQLVNKLRTYIEGRVKEKGQRSTWANEQTYLLELINLSEKISLNYLNNYELAPLPKSNQQAISVYSILQQYKTCNQMTKLIDRFDLNLILSQQNMEMINTLEEINEQQLFLKAEFAKPKRKKQDDKSNKQIENLKLYERRCNFTEILLIQNICQLQFIRNWLDKSISKLNSEIQTIGKIFSEIKDIVELGPSAKESLFLYLQTNLAKLQSKLPNLKLQIKQIHADYKSIQRQTISK